MAHIQIHLDYLRDPIFGSNPIIAPGYIPAALEHLKQHLTLWYLQQMDAYATKALGRPFDILKQEAILREAQQLLAASAQHVHQDTPQAFGKVGPVIQQALGMLKQMQGNAPMDPATQAFVQTSMAETQRRAAKDQQEAQFNAAKLSQDGQLKQQDLQLRLVENTEDNLTAERIKSAELTRDAARLKHEQIQTVVDAQNQAQSTLGGLNG